MIRVPAGHAILKEAYDMVIFWTMMLFFAGIAVAPLISLYPSIRDRMNQKKT